MTLTDNDRATATSTTMTADADDPAAWERRIDEIAPDVAYPARLRQILGSRVGRAARRSAARLPGLSNLAQAPTPQPLNSGVRMLTKWWHQPFGTPDKPASLADVPWDYIEENRDRIPFSGLREYWYPAAMSSKLGRDEPLPVTLVGDNLVLFRDATGRARALENRCPHRGPLLSLGQVGAWEPGTITCRYHGMTFDGDGNCVAYLADGPGSNACGKVTARSYPVEEEPRSGIVFVYMGDRDPPPLLDSIPHAREVFEQRHIVVKHKPAGYSHLALNDNATDMSHVGCLHRTCLLFADQKLVNQVECRDIDNGVWAGYAQPGQHAGDLSLDQIRWYLPGMVYHAPGDLGPGGYGWFWFVPHDETSFTGWLIVGTGRDPGPVRERITRFMLRHVLEENVIPGTQCFYGGDAPMQASQGIVPRWDLDRLTGPDRAVVKVRRKLIAAHQQEVAERAARAAEAEQARVRVRRSSSASGDSDRR